MTTLSIFGLGLIGQQRLAAAISSGVDPKDISAFDPKMDFKILSKFDGVSWCNSVEQLLELKSELVVIATPHQTALAIAENSLNQGSRVLLEKPMGRNLGEAERLFHNANSKNLSIGFNYRFMPAIIKLKEKITSGTLGEISLIRMELGHGGSPNDKESWKLDPVLAGGGALLDPGIHVIDLLMFLFALEVDEIEINGGNDWSGFWKTGVEESINVTGLARKMPFNFTISIVAWRTRFKIEVIGTNGYFEVSGRGRSDGPQITTEGQRWAWQNGRSQLDNEVREVLSKQDVSLQEETNVWLRNEPKVATALDGLNAMWVYSNIRNILALR